jgi:hypothetical protein
MLQMGAVIVAMEEPWQPVLFSSAPTIGRGRDCEPAPQRGAARSSTKARCRVKGLQGPPHQWRAWMGAPSETGSARQRTDWAMATY